jgi:formate hydrogenlyase subunit 3/multisubunit Na+/H+ antiporter MnhD subunit
MLAPNTLALAPLAVIVVLLLAVGGAAMIVARRALVLGASAALCGIGAVLAGACLVAGGPPAGLVLPIGLPAGLLAGGGMALTLDPLAAVFLLITFVAGGFCAFYALDAHDAEDQRALPGLPIFVAAMALTVLAGDGFTLLLGFELMSLVSWLMVLARHEDAAAREAGQFYIGMALFGGVCLVPALALLAPASHALAGPDLRFAAMRAAPPEGWRAAVVLALVLLGAGSKAGLAPLHPWLPLAHPAAPGHISALMSGAMTKVAVYVLIRLLFDICGAAQPLWWGIPLVAMGAASALVGALRAAAEGDIKAVLAASTIENIGLIAIGIGIAMIARGADLPALATLALAGALLHALNHSVFKTLLFLCAGAAAHGAGTRALSRLGGLIHRMPVTTACTLVGGACLAGLPVFAGFAGEWLLLQAVLAAPRIGDLALQTLFTILAAVMALAIALGAVAAVRLVGIAFLGRPRTPRAAVADEPGPQSRRALAGLAVLALVLGLLPGQALWLLEPVLRALTGLGMGSRAGWMTLTPSLETPGYAPLLIVLLLVLAGGGGLWAMRRFAAKGQTRGPAWANGFAAAPAWLPFGDPVTQYGGASFSEPLQRTLGRSVLGAHETIIGPPPGMPGPVTMQAGFRDPASVWLFAPLQRVRAALSRAADTMQLLTIRRILTVMFVVLVLFLAVIAAVEAR